MDTQEFRQYRITLSHDQETGHMVAEVPALGIADDGMDTDEALRNIQEMVVFHLECLIEEGQLIPSDEAQEEGLYLRVKLPARAA